MEMTNLEYIQFNIGYTFKKRGLLCQAFTRKSYSEENKNALHSVSPKQKVEAVS